MQFFRQEQFDSPSVHFMDAYLPEARQQVQSEDFRIADEVRRFTVWPISMSQWSA